MTSDDPYLTKYKIYFKSWVFLIKLISFASYSLIKEIMKFVVDF